MSPLSPFERRILVLILAGKTNEEIAHERSCAVGSVKNALCRIYNKLGITHYRQMFARIEEIRTLTAQE